MPPQWAWLGSLRLPTQVCASLYSVSGGSTILPFPPSCHAHGLRRPPHAPPHLRNTHCKATKQHPRPLPPHPHIPNIPSPRPAPPGTAKAAKGDARPASPADLFGSFTRSLSAGTKGLQLGGGGGGAGGRDARTVFVAGATGKTGIRIVRELLEAGFKVRAAARARRVLRG